MSTARKILWNTVVQIIGKIFLAGLGFVTVKIVTNYLGEVSGYGNYTAVYDYIALFGIVSDLGLYTIAIREMAKDEKNIPKIIGNVLTIRAILAVGVMLVAVIGSFFYGRANSNIVFPLAAAISAVATVFALLTGTVSSVLQVHYKMQYNALASVIGKVITLGYMGFIIFFWKPHDPVSGFYQLLVAGIIGNVAMLIINGYYSSQFTQIRFRFDWDFIKEMAVKSLPYGLALILNTLYFRVGSIMVYRIAGPVQSGIYGVPMRILEGVAIVPLYFMNSVLPTLTQTLKNRDPKYQEVIQYSFDILVMGGIAMAIGIASIAWQAIYIISHQQYLSRPAEGFFGSDMSLQILIFALAFSYVNTLFGFILVAINKQAKLLYVNATGVVVAIVLNLLLIPSLGARGAAITNVAVEFSVAVAAYLFAKKYLDFKLKFGRMLKTILCGIVMGAVIIVLNHPTAQLFHLQTKNILLLVPIGAAVYIGLLFLTGVLNKQMIQQLRKSKHVEVEPEM